MKKITTIQKRENLNAVYRTGDPGPGGAYHDYEIATAIDIPHDVPRTTIMAKDVAHIRFQKGERKDPEARHGVLDSDLLETVRDRLECFQQGEFSTRENACALTHIEEALMWMNRRVEDRIERNILGTYEK